MGILRKLGLLSIFSGLLLTSNVYAEEGKGWTIAPFLDDDFDPHFTAAVTTGSMNLKLPGAGTDTVNGLMLSLNCPWFQPPKGTIRQVFNYNVYDDGNYDVKTFEMNPRYFVSVSPSVQLGVGPGVGYMWIDSDVGNDAEVWTFQVGADLDYRNKNLFLGLGTRYMITEEDDIGTRTDQDADNWVVQLRAGLNF